MMKLKECCKCRKVFYVSKERFFQKDLCDKCAEKIEEQDEKRSIQ